MKCNQEVLEQTQILLEDLSYIVFMLAKHPMKTKAALSQVDLNIKCIKDLLTHYRLAFSAHMPTCVDQLEKSLSLAKKKFDLSLLSMVSKQTLAIIDEMKPGKEEAVEFSQELEYGRQVCALLSNINTLLGFLYLVVLIEDNQEIDQIKNLTTKNFKLLSSLINRLFQRGFFDQALSLQLNQDLQNLEKETPRLFSKASLKDKNFLAVTEKIMKMIKIIESR